MATMAAQPIKEVKPKVNGTSGFGADQIREQAYEQFNDALGRMKAEVKQMQEKIREYDERYQASETVKQQGRKATDFLNATLEEIKATLETLSRKAHAVFIEAKEFSEEQIAVIWKMFNETVEKLRTLAKEFDEKHKVTQQVSDILAPFIERMKGVNDLFIHAREQAVEMGMTGRSYIIKTAAAIETKYSLESKFSELDEKYKISETAKQLQERGEEFIEKQKLMERVQSLDERLTGSKAGEYLKEGVELVKGELEKIQSDFEIARKNSQQDLQEAAKN